MFTFRAYDYLIVAEWCHTGTYIWVNIASSNNVLSDGTKPLSDSMWTYHQWDSAALT